MFGLIKSLFPLCHFILHALKRVLGHLLSVLQGKAKLWWESRGQTEERQFGQFCIVCATGQTWEVNNPQQWVIPETFTFGFATHDVVAGSRSSRFTLLIRQIFKWAGTPWTPATKLQGPVKEILWSIFILIWIIYINTRSNILEH